MFPAVLDPITTTLVTNPLGVIAPGLRAGFDPAALMPFVFGCALWVLLLVARSQRDAPAQTSPADPVITPGLPKAA